MPGDYCSTCGRRLRSKKPKRFDRDWTVRPGVTLKDWREEIKVSDRVTARLCHMTLAEYVAVESGEAEITQEIADKLAHGTGIPARFWLNFERMYREDLAAGRTDFHG